MSDTEVLGVEDVRALVGQRVEEHLVRLRPVLAQAGDDGPVADALEEMLRGGKRLRAAFCYWSFRAHGGRPGTPEAEAALRVGASLELFQAAALFHDDVMDESDTRRGRPAAHRAFAARHTAHGWSGRADQFGTSAAILLGDLALVASEQEFAAALADAPAPRARSARAVFDLMRTEVTVGQYLDVLAQVLPWGEEPAADERRARQVVRAKAARYSVEHPLVLGACLADASTVQLAALRAVGLPLGEAFQLRDDLLGVFGDPTTTGKPAGDDLLEGKRTVLVARAVAAARAAGDTATEALVRRRLGDRSMSPVQVAELAAAIQASGAVDEVEALIDALARQALDAAEAADWAEPGRSRLLGLARAAVDRRA
ncbi:polyprenyl synthetase family protein [Cellulomonas marina]|uniref:Geranylgeranyl diphosphate synthase, type I n=1 Tax=Cellulomonas marina TaxID=988821 RepID=A0A1I0W1Q1_9CELL|nr:polyprenyl synthetase family protein [Cellulomonas marina]GIG27409.1 geranylgeranyl pyrophosphate synthase [Cellulomonas marina]SFA82348.1 geranylgeranyl diphosphate synthase, type I [Cellulomonas marina]